MSEHAKHPRTRGAAALAYPQGLDHVRARVGRHRVSADDRAGLGAAADRLRGRHRATGRGSTLVRSLGPYGVAAVTLSAGGVAIVVRMIVEAAAR